MASRRENPSQRAHNQNMPNSADDSGKAVRISLTKDSNLADVVNLLNGLYQRGQYQVRIDMTAVPRLGTAEIRTLGRFAESFKSHGGYLKLEGANRDILAMIRVLGCVELLHSTLQ